jgi:4-amino-4-deoxy-L-arabinose transferase-like glycosyltransferase
MSRKRSEQPAAADAADVMSTGDLTNTDVLPECCTKLLQAEPGRQDFYVIVALLMAAVAFRLYSLQFFHVIATDGTGYALAARAFASGDWHGLGVSGFYPVLIAFATLFISDLETAGRITSLVCGSLLVIPLFLLGRDLFSRKVAVAACLITIVWPSMVLYSCEVVTQAAYITLQLAAVYCIWRAFMSPSLLRGSLAGLFMGLSYLTRPEAILLSVAIPVVLLFFSLGELREKRLFFWSYAGSFLLFFLLNMLLVHHVTGEWQLSAKTDVALNDALSYYLNIPDINYIPGYEPKSYLDIIREHPAFLWKNSLQNLQTAWQSMLPLPLWILFLVGFFSGGFDKEKNRRRLFLLSTFAPFSVIIVFYYIVGGYNEAYLPVLFLFSAAGFATIEEKVKGYLALSIQACSAHTRTRVPLLLLVAAIYTVTLMVPQIRKDITDADYRPEMDDGRRAEKHIGLLLKNNLPPGKIMTRWARVAFYAEREWVNIPAGVDFKEIIKAAQDSSAQYLVADGMLYSMRPELGLELFAPLMDEEIPPGLFFSEDPNARVEGLHPFLIFNNPVGVGVVVYEIPPEKS